MVDGAERIYESVDTPNETTGFQSIPPENLNAVKIVKDSFESPKKFTNKHEIKNLQITPSGLPPHRLRLRVGANIILLRNVYIDRGQCNGTRLRILELGEHVRLKEFLERRYSVHQSPASDHEASRHHHVHPPVRSHSGRCEDQRPFLQTTTVPGPAGLCYDNQ